MSKFDKYNYNIHRNKKPVKIGDYVYIFDTHKLYEAKTVYKVAYYDKEAESVLVEVSPKENREDFGTIRGWGYYFRSKEYSERYKLKKDKLYWWVSAWLKASTNFINNE